jgi:hypothetical protein
MELLVVLFLFLIVLNAYIKSDEKPADKAVVEDVIDIEAIIKRHGEIIPVTPDLDEMYVDMATPKCEPITIGTASKEAKVYVRAWNKSHRGDRAGHTPKGKTLHDKRQRGSYSLAMLSQDAAYQAWFDESL